MTRFLTRMVMVIAVMAASGHVYALGVSDLLVKVGRCTGFITGPDSLITAAECVDERMSYAGVSSCRRHPNYSPQGIPTYNIAVCKLDQEAVLDQYGWVTARKPWSKDRMQTSGFGPSGDVQSFETFIYLIGSTDLIFETGEMILGSPIYRIIDDKYDVGAVVSFDSDGMRRGYGQRLDLFNVTTFLGSFADDTGVQICGITPLCNPGQTDECGREREIVAFYQNELGLAKEFLAQCVESSKARL